MGTIGPAGAFRAAGVNFMPDAKVLDQAKKVYMDVCSTSIFNAKVQKFCTDRRQAPVSAQTIQDYQVAVDRLYRCLGALTKQGENHLTDVWKKLRMGRERDISDSDRDACAISIGRAMGLTVTDPRRIVIDFNADILEPMRSFVEAIGSPNNVRGSVALLTRYKEFISP